MGNWADKAKSIVLCCHYMARGHLFYLHSAVNPEAHVDREFIGFDGLDDDSIISVRIISDKLVINIGEIQTEVGKLVVVAKLIES